MFNNINDALNWLQNIRRKEKRTDLSRITEVLNYFDNPQESFAKIHVAGTNGKGSTCQILNSCLQQKYKVGVFSSPYVVEFNERIKINNDYIDNDSLLEYINIVKKYSDEYNLKNGDIIPFFELTFVISLLYFKKEKVDIAIIEVGVGGLLDCTNCFNYEVSVITNIGYDHVDYLGHTLEEIASHKLGILKQENILYTTVQEDLRPLFKKYCKKNKVKNNSIEIENINILNVDINGSIFEFNGFKFETSLIGIHQVYNTVLAIHILNDFFKFSYYEINKFIKDISFNGRFETIQNKPLFIVDGAHNVDGIKSLVKSIKLIFNKKVHFCFAAMKDKDVSNMISEIQEVSETITFTQINYYRTTECNEFKTDHKNVFYYENIDDAISSFKKMNDDDIVVFTGSLYFVSEIRKII